MAENSPQVVIVGAGFGGLWAAKALGGTDLAVRLIDKNNYHSFYPLLYQVAAAEVEPELIAHPVRRIVRDKPNVRFAMLDVQRIDLERQLVCGPDQEFHYDYLVLALGSTNHFFNTPGAEANSFTLKSIEEGTVLRNHILQCVEKAAKLPPATPAGRTPASAHLCDHRRRADRRRVCRRYLRAALRAADQGLSRTWISDRRPR